MYREAERWFTVENGRWVFSFRHICDVLGLDAGTVRRRLFLRVAEHRAVPADQLSTFRR